MTKSTISQDEQREKRIEYARSRKESKAQYMQKWRAANKEHRAEYAKKYREGNEEYQRKKRESDRQRYHSIYKYDSHYKARQRRSNSEYNRTHREHRTDLARIRRRSNPEINKRNRANSLASYRRKSKEERKALYVSRKEYQRKYREAHKAELSEKSRKRWAANPEKNAKQAKAYYEKHKLDFIMRARKRMGFLTGTYTDADIDNLYQTQCGKCAGCKKDLSRGYEIDHVMPLALDPAGDRLENLQLLCRRCNRSKHAMHPDAWAARIGKLFV